MFIHGHKIVDILTVRDSRGNLSAIEENGCIPFSIKRIFYLYGQLSKVFRGGHAHKTCEQFIIPISGSFTAILKNKKEIVEYKLSKPNVGLYIGPMIWVDIVDLDINDVCLVLASEFYDENDYIRDYKVFLKEVVKCKFRS